MEGLNLADLDFDESTMNLFEEGVDIKPIEKPAGDTADTTGTPPASTDDKGDENINTDGEGANPESVATQSKDSNQVQADKAADGNEGSDSSSPKLNETEQLYSNLAAEFKSKGALSELEDTTDIKSLKDLNAAIKKEVDSRLTNRQKTIEEAQKTGAPITDVSKKLSTIEKLKAVTPEFLKDESKGSFRMSAIIQDFVEKGYGEDRAKAMAQRSVDAGTDIEDAEFALASLIKTEEAALSGLIAAAKEKEDSSLKDIKGYISETPEVIPGISLTDSQKDELYAQITTDLGNKENAFVQAQKADPIGSRIKLEALFYLTGGLKDFSIFGNKAETKITNNIENLIRGANFTEAGGIDTSSQDTNSNFKLSDLKDFDIE
jgi:predicted nucleic acid-binding OB-fold protein